MILLIIFPIFSLAHLWVANVGEFLHNKDPWSNIPKIVRISDYYKTQKSLYKLYYVFKGFNSCDSTEETCQLKTDIVKRFSTLHADMILTDTLKDLIIRNEFEYAHFYCWALAQPKDIGWRRNFEGQLHGSETIVRYFRTRLDIIYQQQLPIDFHSTELMIQVVKKFALPPNCRIFVQFWEKNLHSPIFLVNLLKMEPHAQFEEIIRKYDLEGEAKSIILNQEGFIALQYFSRSHFIREGRVVNWGFVNSLSPIRLLALFNAYLETDTEGYSVALLLQILESKFEEKSAMMKLFLKTFFPFYQSMFNIKDITKDEYENIIGMGHRLRRLFKSQKIRNGFLFKKRKQFLYEIDE
jgi:hypothetical protein